MSRFYVGQRVRILWSIGWPELAGQEGVIVGRSRDAGIYGRSEWWVAPDSWGTYIAPRRGVGGGKNFSPSSNQLSPITDANTIVSWAECAWRPEGVQA